MLTSAPEEDRAAMIACELDSAFSHSMSAMYLLVLVASNHDEIFNAIVPMVSIYVMDLEPSRRNLAGVLPPNHRMLVGIAAAVPLPRIAFWRDNKFVGTVLHARPRFLF